MHRSKLVTAIVGLCLAAFGVSTSAIAAQQSSSLFSYQCGSSSILFALQGSPVIQVTFDQVSLPLSTAIAAQQNQLITSANGVSLYALKSNELQIHLDSNPDGTRFVVNSAVCGSISTAPGSYPVNPDGTPYNQPQTQIGGQANALAYTTGQGSATAFAQVTGYGEVIAIARASGYGATAFAQAISYGPPPTAIGARVHVVQPGETLYRIAVHNGTTVAVLAQINNISDPNRIYPGQTIHLP